jgi:peptide chain release factor subunit 3
MVDRQIDASLMIPISEKYKDMGTIVVGKVESGSLRKGDSLLLMPNKDVVEVAAIFNEMEDEVQSALCGDNVRIRLRGVEDEDITPGFVLTSTQKPIHAVRHFQAQLAILEHKSIICAGYSAVMHIHTLAEEVTLSVRMIRHTLTELSIRTCRLFSIILTRLPVASRGNPLNLPKKVAISSSVVPC